MLTYLGEVKPIYEYHALGSARQVSALKLVIGFLIISFVVLELSPTFSKIALDRRWLPLGGLIRVLRRLVGASRRLSEHVSD